MKSPQGSWHFRCRYITRERGREGEREGVLPITQSCSSQRLSYGCGEGLWVQWCLLVGMVVVIVVVVGVVVLVVVMISVG